MFLELSCSCSASELRPHSQVPVDMFGVRAYPFLRLALAVRVGYWLSVFRFAAGVRHVAVDGLLREPGARGQTVAPCEHGRDGRLPLSGRRKGSSYLTSMNKSHAVKPKGSTDCNRKNANRAQRDPPSHFKDRHTVSFFIPTMASMEPQIHRRNKHNTHTRTTHTHKTQNACKMCDRGSERIGSYLGLNRSRTTPNGNLRSCKEKHQFKFFTSLIFRYASPRTCPFWPFARRLRPSHPLRPARLGAFRAFRAVRTFRACRAVRARAVRALRAFVFFCSFASFAPFASFALSSLRAFRVLRPFRVFVLVARFAGVFVFGAEPRCRCGRRTQGAGRRALGVGRRAQGVGRRA